MTNWKNIHAALDAAEAATEPTEVLARLRDARDAVDATLNEKMAETLVTSNTSLRSVALSAGFTENAVGPRLGSTVALSAYARDDGRVTVEGIHRARYDAERDGARAPMTFVRRKDEE